MANLIYMPNSILASGSARSPSWLGAMGGKTRDPKYLAHSACQYLQSYDNLADRKVNDIGSLTYTCSFRKIKLSSFTFTNHTFVRCSHKDRRSLKMFQIQQKPNKHVLVVWDEGIAAFFKYEEYDRLIARDKSIVTALFIYLQCKLN